MSYILKKQGHAFNVPTRVYICDSLADRDQLKTEYIPATSEAYVLGAGGTAVKKYVLNDAKDWVEEAIGSGGGSSSVQSGYYYEGQFYKDSEHTQPIEPKVGNIYIDITPETPVIYTYISNTYKKLGGEDTRIPIYIHG